ncbi:MAG TPA: ester cyclase [Euzebyales bacterium]|nr:ester cyclase [Euzebyales bacterium]
MSPQQMKRRARRLDEEVFTQGDLTVADELVADDCVDHIRALPGRPGVAGLKDWVTTLRRTFPDLHLIVEDQITEADRVATRSTVRGTHAGAFLGVAPTGRQVAFEVIDINRIGADGRIVERWAAVDTASLLVQLGAPPPDTAA